MSRVGTQGDIARKRRDKMHPYTKKALDICAKLSENTRFIYALSMLLPMLIMGTAFALNDIYPFGDRQAMIIDYWHQYFPFASVLWHVIREGGSLRWSFVAAGGHDYIAHMAYYLASPFNFIAALFPHSMLQEVLTVAMLIRLGLAGLFVSMYMKYVLNKLDILLPIFATLFALCAFTLGYNKNIMWFDTFAMFPLVMLGVHKIVNENKYRLFVISLTLSVIFNFYIGLFACIFTALLFFVLSVVKKLSLREFGRKLLMIGIAAAVALGMTAFITIPTFMALQYTYNAVNNIHSFPADRLFGTIHSWFNIFGNFIAFTPATLLDTHAPNMPDLPNLYTGMISAMLFPVFFVSNKISLREKLAYGGILLFIIVSINNHALNFIWHGMSFTASLPHRYSFTVSFLLAFMAYKVYLLFMEDGIKAGEMWAMGLSAAFFLLMAGFGWMQAVHVGWSFLLAVVYMLIFAVFTEAKGRGIPLKTIKLALCAVILAELSITTVTTVINNGNSSRHEYPWANEAVQDLLAQRQTADNNFERTEMTRWWSTNDGSMYHYQGLSTFTSLINTNTQVFMRGLGLVHRHGHNSIAYAETSPLTNAFLNMRYLVNRAGVPNDNGVFWEVIAGDAPFLLLQNTRHLPLGFMVGAAVSGYTGDNHNPFINQNDLFNRATGLSGDLFTLIEPSGYEHQRLSMVHELGMYSWTINEGAADALMRFEFEAPYDGIYFAFPDISHVNTAYASVNEGALRDFEVTNPFMFRLGDFDAGAPLYIEATTNVINGTARVYVAHFNSELFEEGFAILSSQTMTTRHASDTRFVGDITVHEDGMFYASIPHAGLWRAFVNGQEREIITVGGAMLGFYLEAGQHEVELRFHNSALNIGMAISVTSLLVFVSPVAVAFVRKRGRKDGGN